MIDVMRGKEGGKRIKQEVDEKVETSGESGGAACNVVDPEI